MFLRIQASSSKYEGKPLYGRAIYISIALFESHRINGKPRQKYIGYIAYISVGWGENRVNAGEYFWRQVGERLTQFNVPAEKQKQFIEQIAGYFSLVEKAKCDPDKRAALETNPNKVLSALRGSLGKGAKL